MELTDGFDPRKIIRSALSKGGDFAELYLEDTSTSSVVCEENKIERVVSGRDRGAGIRVISGLKTFYAYTNDLEENALMDVAGAVSAAVRGAAEGGTIGEFKRLSAKGYEVEIPPGEAGLDKKVEIVMAGNETGWKIDDRIKQVKVVYGDALKSVAVINSDGEWTSEDKSSILLLCQIVAISGEVIQTGYEPIGGLEGLEVFKHTPPEAVAETAARRALMMLDARRAPGGAMPVVLSSEAGGTMIHEAVGHGLEADLAQEGLSVYSGKIGEEVASPLITVIDDGTIATKRGSGYFDGEGTKTQRTLLIEDGVLKTFMYDRLSAMKAETESTGNGRRESYQHRPIPRMTNTMIAPGKSDPEDILRSTKSGLFVKKMGGGQVNTVNGDFVFEVTEGYLIENGKIAEPIRGATLTGNGPEVLKTIDMVASDLGFGIGTCGKDGQGVPVSDAQPTLRIPEIVVGGGVE